MARAVRPRIGTGRGSLAARLGLDQLRQRLGAGLFLGAGGLLSADLLSYRAGDPSLDTASAGPVTNWFGAIGADAADVALQTFGLGAWVVALALTGAGLVGILRPGGAARPARVLLRFAAAVFGVIARP